MRLTLRTLLAYMDEILEPKDAEDIGKKIEDSETATGLLHRIRDVMGRLRLKAPDVTDPGAGLDPNTVAEYLDNTLPDDRVPDFEKVCLESDMHLAEVASCHQVLALVLGEPAEVDPASREHMYQLPQVLAEQAAMEAQAAGEQHEEEPARRRRRPKPIVPDYLRESRGKRRLWPAALVVLLVVVVGVVVLGINGQLDFLGIGPEFWGRQVAQKPAKAPAPDEGKATVPDEGVPGEDVPGEEPAAPAEQPSDVEGPPDVTSPDATPPDATPTEPVVPPTKVPAEEPLPGPPQPPAEATQLPVEEGPLPEGPVKLPPPPGEGPDEAVKPPDEPPPAAPPAPIPVERMGRFISDGQILLQLDPQSGSWQRVPAQGILTPQYELLALPTFRPLIAMAAGVTVHLVGPAQVKLQSTDEQEIPGLSVAYGQLVIRTVGKAETRLRLNVGKRTGLITFQDAESTVAVEVTRQLVAGADPETQPGAVTFDLIAVSGKIIWQEGADSTPIEIDAPGRQRLSGPPPSEQPPPKPELPKWIASDTTGLLDRRASGTLAQAIEADRPVGLVLRELTEHRQREVRRLAMRCLGHVGEFDMMVGSLDDPNKRLIWPDCVEYLQAAVSRGPAQAARVRKAFEKDYGEQGDKLVRLLWGFTQDQLKNGQDAMLVEYLDDQRLIFRVLSFWNLKRITGAGLYYQADATAAKRQQSIRKWRQRQEAGEIRFKSPPKKTAP